MTDTAPGEHDDSGYVPCKIQIMSRLYEGAGALDEEAIGRGANIVDGLVPGPTRIDIVFADDFVDAVRENLAVTDPPAAAIYAAHRGAIAATAKTLPHRDGNGLEIFVAGDVARVGAPTSELERLLAHEACHARLDVQGEDMASMRRRRGIGPDTRLGMLCWISARGCEEYRVEAALPLVGEALGQDMTRDVAELYEGFGHLARQFAHTAATAYEQRRLGGTVDQMLYAINASMRDVMAVTGYVAAATSSTPTAHDLGLDPEIYDRYLGEPWAGVLTGLRRFDDALRPMGADAAYDLGLQVCELVGDWLIYVGFEVTDTETGMHVEIVDHYFPVPDDPPNDERDLVD